MSRTLTYDNFVGLSLGWIAFRYNGTAESIRAIRMPPSDLKITSGLSLFDCQDHHAILGIPLNSDQKVIRRRYLKIARRLHPDSVGQGVDKQTASMLLSKLVNPSYEFLSQPSNMEEYNILLKLVGQRYSQEMNRFPIKSREAKELLQSQDYEGVYQTNVEALATHQFDQLNRYLHVTGVLSELNLVYLYRLEGAPAVASASSSNAAGSGRSTHTPRTTSSSTVTQSSGGSRGESVSSGSPGSSNAEPVKTVNHDLVDQYCRRAEELIAKACYLEAVRELKEVVEGNNPIDPNNSKVYTLLGDIYKNHMKQPVMARPFYTRALRSDPDNALLKKKLEQISPASQRPKSKSGAKSTGKAVPKDKKKSGFFNFLSRNK